MRTAASTLLVLALVLGPIHADDPAPRIAVPAGIPVRMDGWPNPSEWSDAARLDMGAGATLWIKHVRGTLLLGFDGGRPWPDRAHLIVYLAPGEAPKGVNTPGALRIDYEPREHDRPHVIAHRATATVPERVNDRVVARFSASRNTSTIEMAIPGDTLPPAPHRLAVQWTVPGNAGLGHWPRSLQVTSRERGIPTGLQTGTGWGVLTGVDGKGPGAYPASRWKAWIDTDRTFRDRADAMHSYARLLDEEWRNQPKDDAIAEKEFFANMRFVQAREPLTTNDLLAKAMVLHWSNRLDEALGVYETLAAGDPELAKTTASRRARLLTSMHRFRDAYDVWMSIVTRPGMPAMLKQQYKAEADRAMRYAGEWAAEQQLRQDLEQARAKRPEAYPLVALTTPRGTSILLLDRVDRPKLVDHFLSFVKDGSYAGTLFHRVHGDAMAVGGAMVTKEHGCDFSGADRAQVSVRSIPEAKHGNRGFFRGAVALLWHADRTLKSDFFIVTGAHPDWRKERNVVIGHVLSGQEAIERISRCDKIESMEVLTR